MFFYQVDKSIVGICKVNVLFDTFFSDVKVDLARFRANISKIGIGHLARTIDDASHDGNFDSGKVVGALLDPFGDILEVKKGASAARA